ARFASPPLALIDLSSNDFTASASAANEGNRSDTDRISAAREAQDMSGSGQTWFDATGFLRRNHLPIHCNMRCHIRGSRAETGLFSRKRRRSSARAVAVG